jgi:hypothetical protein
VDVEVALCKSQTDRVLDNLRTQLIMSYTYREQVKKGHQRVHHVMATRKKATIIAKNMNILDAANKYRWAWRMLSILRFNDPNNYLVLETHNVRIFTVATEQQQLG